MVNKKKKRKNKEKKAADNAAVAAAAHDSSSQRPDPPPIPPPRVATTTTTSKDFTFDMWLLRRGIIPAAFPTGCLHSLREDERDTHELFKNMYVFFKQGWTKMLAERFMDATDSSERERLVRFQLFMAIKTIIGKPNQYKSFAEECFRNVLSAYGVIKCGSVVASNQSLSENADMALLEENQVSFRALVFALEEVFEENYHGLVCILNEASPCNCLEAEVERSRLEEERVPGQANLWACANNCGKKEESYDDFRWCAGCQISFYCSGRCYRRHWKVASPLSLPHKIACEAFQELVSYLRGGGSAAAGTPNNNDDSAA